MPTRVLNGRSILLQGRFAGTPFEQPAAGKAAEHRGRWQQRLVFPAGKHDDDVDTASLIGRARAAVPAEVHDPDRRDPE